MSKRRPGTPFEIVMSLALLLAPCVGHTQFFATCDMGASKTSLERSIQQHNDHIAEIREKFVTGFVRAGAKGSTVGLAEVQDGLSRLAPRRAAVLFFAYQNGFGQKKGNFCAWLISPHLESVAPAKIVGVARELDRAEFDRLRPDIVNALGVIALPGNVAPGESSVESALHNAREVLLPAGLQAPLLAAAIDTLIVVPTFDLDAVPFALLPIDDRRTLVDLVAITIAPGFFVFERPAIAARRYSRPVVVGPRSSGAGDPSAAQFQAEARSIAHEFGAEPLAGVDATVAALTTRLQAQPGPDLIYISAHGRADSDNPLDGGYVLLDKQWTGRQISKLQLRGAQPLVILSACQSGLGKIFDAGSIGLARAWYQAGASNVVVSLWSVYQSSTSELMRDLVNELNGVPVDVALQRAMIAMRDGLRASHRDDSSRWAGFAVFGLPEMQSKH